MRATSIRRVAAAAAAVMLAVAAGAGTATAGGGDDQPRFTTEGSAPFGFRTANTIPYWSSSFSFDGTTYPYTMVGTAPALRGAKTTTVPTVLIPVTFRFSKDAQALASQIPPGCVFDANHNVVPGSCVAVDATFDAGSRVAPTVQSPIFQKASYRWSKDANVQYGDAIQRAEFNTFGGWHTNLGQPVVEPVTTIDVPANVGVAVVNRRGVLTARVDDQWFSNKLHELVNALHVQATELPIVLTNDVYLFDHKVGVALCCTLGYHGVYATRGGNGAQAVQTYIYSAYATSGALTAPAIADIHALSHEVSEWMNDPYLWNATPEWFAPGYGCDDVLETGDPVVGVAFELAMANGITYHPEDEVYLSWFARQVPSTAFGGLYTYLGTFTGPSTGC